MQALRGSGVVRFALVATMLAGWGLTMGAGTSAAESVEQPRYEVVAVEGSVEIRRYGERIAAEAAMGDGPGAGRQSAFLALAGFIFATSREGPAVAMTAPVAMERASQPIAMTAPVAMEPGAEGGVMRFFMPAEYTLETLPRPGDDRVRIVTVPAQTLAVLRFSGEADEAAVTARTSELLASLAGAGWRPIGVPGLFGYDPPMTPPDQRRNEVYVEVAELVPAAPAAP